MKSISKVSNLKLPVLVFVLIHILAQPSISQAAFVFSVEHIPIGATAIASDPQLANFVTIDLKITATAPNRFNVAGMISEPATPGFFYQHPFGGLTLPNPALVNLFPALAFDTYVTTPGEIALGLTPDSPFAFVGTGGSRLDTAQANLAWATLGAPEVYGTFQIARLTFSRSLSESVTVTLRGDIRDSTQPTLSRPFGPFVLRVPEPAMAATTIGGLWFAARRRQR
jgi:hypothetical protein